MTGERRVIWRDGGLVSSKHLETWQDCDARQREGLARASVEAGLFRDSLNPSASSFNLLASVTLIPSSASLRAVTITLKKLGGICPDGAFFHIEDPVSHRFELDMATGAERRDKQVVFLEVVPPRPVEVPAGEPVLIAEDVEVGEASVALSLLPGPGSLPIAEIVIGRDDRPSLAADFVPPSPRLDGSEFLDRARRGLEAAWLSAFAQPLLDLVDRPLEESPATRAWVEIAWRLLEPWWELQASFREHDQPTRDYFRAWGRFASRIAFLARHASALHPSAVVPQAARRLDDQASAWRYRALDLRATIQHLHLVLDEGAAGVLARLPRRGGRLLPIDHIESTRFDLYQRVTVHFPSKLGELIGPTDSLSFRLRTGAGQLVRGSTARLSAHLEYAEIPVGHHVAVAPEPDSDAGSLAAYRLQWTPTPQDLAERRLTLFLPPPLGRDLPEATRDAEPWLEVRLSS